MSGLVVLTLGALLFAAAAWAADRWPAEWVGRLLEGGSRTWDGGDR